MYGKYKLLDELTAYRVRPAPDNLPGKFDTGTQNHEGIAGVLGAVEYLEWVGETFGEDYLEKYSGRGASDHAGLAAPYNPDAPLRGRRLRLKQAMSAIRAYEFELSRALLDVLEETPGATVYGLTERRRLEERVPTVSFTLSVGAGLETRPIHPRRLAEALTQEDIYVWDGNYYALAVTERLGLEERGGMVRVGPVYYNTVEEISKFGEALGKIATGGA